MKPIAKGVASIIGVGLVVSIVMIGAPIGAQDVPDEVIEVGGIDSLDVKQDRPFARILLPNGNQVAFLRLNGRDDGHAFGVVEKGLRSNRSAFDNTDAHRNPVELFNAISEPGTRIPQQLINRFGEPVLGRQGWLLGDLQPSAAGADMCNATDFQNHILGKNYAKAFLKLNTEPGDYAWVQAFYQYLFPQWSWWGTLYNIELFYTRVAVCDLGNHPAYCKDGKCFWFHPGPIIWFRYQNANNWPSGFNGFALIEDIEPLMIGNYYTWNFYTAPNWDWQTSITHAQEGDRFNIGLTWSNTQ